MKSIKYVLLLFSLTLIVVLITPFFMFVSLHFKITSQYDEQLKRLFLEERIPQDTNDMILNYYYAVSDVNNTQKLRKFNQSVKQMNNSYLYFDNAITNDDSKTYYIGIKNGLNNIENNLQQGIIDAQYGDIQDNSSIYEQANHDNEFIKELTGNLLLKELQGIEATQTKLNQLNNLALGFILATFMVIIIASGFFSWIFSFRISSPLIALAEVAKKISQGNLDLAINPNLLDKKDETGILAISFQAMLVTIHDKLKQLQASEASLRTEKDYVTAIVSSMGEGLIVIDVNGTIISMNQTAEKLVSFSASESIGHNYFYLLKLFKDDVQLRMEERPAYKAIKTGEVIDLGLEDNIYFQTKTNQKKFISLSVSPLKSTKVTGAVIIFRDLTLERHYKEEIEKQVAERTRQLYDEGIKLQASINSLSVGFIMVDRNNNIVIINQTARQNLCASNSSPLATEKECTLDYIENELKEAINLKAFINECFVEKKTITIKELPFRNKFLKIFISPIIALNVIGAVILIEDITEAKILERSKDEFFSIASHELRTPLTAIRGNTSMIQRYYGDKLQDPELKEMIHDVHESSVRLIEIVNDFLDSSRLEMKKMGFKTEEFDLVQLAKDTAKEYITSGSIKNLSLKIDEPPAPIPHVFADKNKVKQVLINLIGNSIKFTDLGGITVHFTLEGTLVKAFVSDTGRGIPPQSQILLFRKFQQAEDNILTRDATKGTGLGLYISKLIIEGMGGQIKIESSELGKGTTFSITLPTTKQFVY